MTAHTPGSWTVSPKLRRPRKGYTLASHSWQFRILACPPGGSMFRVATVEGPSNADSFAVCEANARLIAAAPDMLAALRGMLTAYDGADSIGAIDMAASAAATARAVLKAAGLEA